MSTLAITKMIVDLMFFSASYLQSSCIDLLILRNYLCHLFPTSVWIEAIDRSCKISCIRTKVLFINDAIVADNECLDAGHLVCRRVGEQRKAAYHRSLLDKVEFPKRRRFSL